MKGDEKIMFEEYSKHESRGRPTRSPKNRKVQSRIDEETDSILVEYCVKNDVSESDAIRRAIRKLAQELKEKE